MASVMVYYFTQYNIVTDETVHSARPATLEAIAKIENAITDFRQPLKKMDRRCALYRAFSRRQSFETHTNWFALIPQVHGAQPVDHRREQALISSG
jgi:hypothetical protein